MPGFRQLLSELALLPASADAVQYARTPLGDAKNHCGGEDAVAPLPDPGERHGSQ